MLKKGLLLFSIPVALYLMLSAPMGLMNSQESVAQTSANQTMQNQTVLQRGNVTEEDLEVIENNLNAARESLLGNFNQTAFFRLSDVSNQLFRIERLAGPEGISVMQELKPLQDIIDRAQDALRNKDSQQALQEINSAGIEVLRLNQQVSTAA